jgi:hypothetical protein
MAQPIYGAGEVSERIPEPESLWDYDDVMSYTGYSRRFLQCAVASGTLKWTGSPNAKRFRKGDVDRWLDSMAGMVVEEQPRRRTGRPYKPVYIKT